MQLIDGNEVYSATDLVGFLECEHLTNLERAAMARLTERPNFPDPALDRIAARGLQHEHRFLAELQEEGLNVVTIELDGSSSSRLEQLNRAASETIEAMRGGADVVYQATFFDGRWRGHADFLRKVDAPSDLGAWSYEAWDTKLARQVKGSAILQLCLYSSLLADVQGLQPESMVVALGGSGRRTERHRFADYAAYFRLVRAEFLRTVGGPAAAYPPSSRPEPVEHCDICRWRPVCTAERRRTDDLSLVAGITGRQRSQLREGGVHTRTSLAKLPLPLVLDPPLRGSSRQSMVRSREQARLQVEGEQAGKTLYELLEVGRTAEGDYDPSRGLLTLPAPSPGDLFFDIEGDPFALEDGVEYLFGVIEPGGRDDTGTPRFHAFWSIDKDGEVTPQAERKAFEALVDLLIDRLDRDHSMHVYHFAPYEPSAVGRLMGRYGTREDEVDRLLRGGVFVDLFRATRQSVRASVESYSIKRLEPLYGFTREVDLRDAGSSIVAFETWLELGTEQAAGRKEILDRIEGYNRDDCLSTWRLRDWLEERRDELGTQLKFELPRPSGRDGAPPEAQSAALAQTQAVVDALVQGVPEDRDERTDEQQARWLLAQLLNWHRREDKSSWWRYFYLLGLSDEDLVEEPDAIGDLSYLGQVGTVARSAIYRFRFPPQEHKITAGTAVRDRSGASPGEVFGVDDEQCTIDIKRGLASLPPEPTSLVPYDIVSNQVQRDSLLHVGEWVAEHGIDASGPFRAARDLLLRRAPRLSAGEGDALIYDGETAREAGRRLVAVLDETCLAIQGPPGSGKTALAAEMIVDLAQQGKRIGVTANSHQVIGNLLREAAEAAARRGLPLRVAQNPGSQGAPTYAGAQAVNNDQALSALADQSVDVVGGTTWLWSRQQMFGSVDVLFVEEAGQMSLANTVAVAPAARSLVLLGDPQQLDQPLKGSHPPGAERSALAHVLGHHATMPPELGLFLETTWRLHPDICAYTSEVFYDGRLRSEPGREAQRVAGMEPLTGSGVRFVPVHHDGNASSSDEEATEIARLLGSLLAAEPRWIDDKAAEASLLLPDVLVITPYNMQVRAISEAVAGVRVGTVDKFQGQQAPIAIYSMATSSPEEAPRGMEFLYSVNRLNVATSRARCLAVVVGSPQLLRVRCRTPRQMRLANALARFVELGGG